ncbi:uncharacterized protein LOC143008155 [Genypterus blacodes]|uniref:uncharacterized protein LOC143008155 n=1 Tax=Genypterus blacodes TaxID=154954 RepID=UPI003F75E36C
MSGVRAVNLDTYSLSLLTAKEDIINPRASTNWALFTYDGISNKLKLADSGVGGLSELAGKFNLTKPQYGLCRLGGGDAGSPRIAMIIWVGQDVDDYRRTECASHVPAIKHFFKEAHAFISAEKVEDVTEEKITAELSKAQARAPGDWAKRRSRSVDTEEKVGTNYRKTNAAMEMRRINRDSFWARAEREEEERKDDERKRAAEDRRRMERERVTKERKDEEERDRKMNEKLQMIETQRRQQAEQEEGLRKKETQRWELQQREHQDDMRARLRRSESIEKAAEAAALVSQRSMNPREFFRQLSSSAQSPTSPGSSRTGKPFRRYQRSLTDTAFIFSKSEEAAAAGSTSPHTSPLVSPFSRAPTSPPYRTTSPPTSPDFRPLSSPQRPRALSPPLSPLHPSPPASALPSIPLTNQQVEAPVEPEASSPTEPTAPPASPTLLASLSSSLLTNNHPQLQPEALAASPADAPAQPESSSSPPACFELEGAPQAPTAPLPQRHQPKTDTTEGTLTELVSDTGYAVHAVLLEEDEEEEEEVEPEIQTRSSTATEPTQTEEEEQEEEETKHEAEPAVLVEPEEVMQEEEDAEEDGREQKQSEDSKGPDEPVQLSEKEEELVVTDAKAIRHQIEEEDPVVVSTNGITNGDHTQEQNGIERSLSPSDTEFSSPELTVCYDLHGTVEKEEVAEEEEVSENGQEVTPEQQMCVRALYDYQAEDESEISFEPGDIIKDVETVDKAWWRGWSKDGRQGLFPANYVETI